MTKEEAFRDWGTANGWNSETIKQFDIASKIHEADRKEHPELHKVLPQKYNYRCWHEYNCSCGFSHSVDSSD